MGLYNPSLAVEVLVYFNNRNMYNCMHDIHVYVYSIY